MGKPSLREELLDAGFKVMFRSGYTAASVRDICEAAQVPLGSFTNHFRSKEAFAQEVLDRYFAGTKSVVEEALEDKSLTPRQRLMRYLDLISGRIADRKWNLGCIDRRFQPGDFYTEQTSAPSTGSNLQGVARPVCFVYRGRSSHGRNRFAI